MAVSIFSLIVLPVFAAENTIDNLLQEYQAAGAAQGNAQRGEVLWNKTFNGNKPYAQRSCKTCHSSNVKNHGKHIRTGKTIKPLAPSVNPTSLVKSKNIEKWFKRNCKWTIGKECSAQQKADILIFLKQQ